MGRDDPVASGDSSPEETEASPDLPFVESTFQDDLTRAFGEASEPTVDLEGGSTAAPGAARIARLRERGEGPRRYELKEEIGRGGMGVVLRVFDADLRRHLAMKVIRGPGGKMRRGTQKIALPKLVRFLEEAQVTGQLDHPGVVPVHELGVDAEGRVYFTMRLVRGTELRKIIAQVGAGDDEWNLTRALGVLLKVCEAMSYAHDKGVVHRDLKPSNVMVGEHGEVYVMDWGVARVQGREDPPDVQLAGAEEGSPDVRTDRTELREGDADSPLVTRDGKVLGTPNFMPPEQAEGKHEELGPRSDVYAVGAILYNLLTGRMPYSKPGERLPTREVLKKLKAGPPRTVSALAPGQPAELEAICEKAMARDPATRYANMGELALDLRAYLENRVVQAHRTGAVIEFKKWVQRNRTLAATLSAAVLLVVGGSTATSTVLATKNEQILAAKNDADEARRAAENREQEAQVARLQAQADATEAQQQRAAANLVSDFLIDLFESPSPELAQGETVTAKELLDRGAQRIRTELGGEPFARARLMGTMSQAYRGLGRYADAEPLLVEALEVYREVLGEDHPRTLVMLNNLAALYMRQTRLEEAERLMLDCLERRRRVLPDDDHSTLFSMTNLAGLYVNQGRFAEAEALQLETLEKFRASLGIDHEDTLNSLSNLGTTYSKWGRYREAEPLLVECLTRRRALLGDDHPDTLVSISNLAWQYVTLGNHDAAGPLLEESLQRKRVVLGEDHPETLISTTNLAGLRVQQGRFAEAEKLLTETVGKWRERGGPDHPETLATLNNLAMLHENQGHYELAETMLVELLEKRRIVSGDTHPDTLVALNNLGALYLKLERLAEAEELTVECLRGQRERMGDGHTDTLRSMASLSVIYARQGRPAEAEPLRVEALAGYRAALGPDHETSLAMLGSLASFYFDQRRYEDAEPLFQEALRRGRAVLGEGHLWVREILDELGVFYTTWLRDVRFEKGADHPDTLPLLLELGRVCVDVEQPAFAEPLYLECLDKRLALLGEAHADTLDVYEALAELYSRTERWDEAEPFARELLELTPADTEEHARREQLLRRIVEALEKAGD